jgi:predicted DCC family thiol-disulfide oxidoreductase YuxK
MGAVSLLPRPVLLYDGGCRLCRFAARVVASLDRGGRLALLPLGDEAAQTFVAELPENERLASWHLVRPGGRIASRGAAGIELLDTLDHPRLARAAGRAGTLCERAYGTVANRRDLLGRFVPNGPAPRRFP